MSLSECCIKGVKHDGTPQGKLVHIGGSKLYEAIPEGDYDRSKALLILTDVYGIPLVNVQLLADSFADAGFQTYIVDYLDGDEINLEAMQSGKVDFQAWLKKHGADVTRPYIDKAIKALKDERGVTTFASNGYCFGGRYTIDLALEGLIKVGIVSHPSLLKIPDDLHALRQHSIPFLWNTCEVDSHFPPEHQALADQVFADDKNYRRTYWPSCSHGYAVRGDPSVPEIKAGKEGTFAATVKMLQDHL